MTTTFFTASVTHGGSHLERFKIAIIGGGPGGLFSAWHLAAKAGLSCDITIFEADSRLGGKIQTRQFPGIGPYEAGVAEIYDYSRLGPDPLHDLIIKELGLQVKYIKGGPCIIEDQLINETEDLEAAFGKETCDQAMQFRERCAQLLNPEAFYFSIGKADNAHPWAHVSGESLLAKEIPTTSRAGTSARWSTATSPRPRTRPMGSICSRMC